MICPKCKAEMIFKREVLKTRGIPAIMPTYQCPKCGATAVPDLKKMEKDD